MVNKQKTNSMYHLLTISQGQIKSGFQQETHLVKTDGVPKGS